MEEKKEKLVGHGKRPGHKNLMPAPFMRKLSKLQLFYDSGLKPTPWIIRWVQLFATDPDTGEYGDVTEKWRVPLRFSTRKAGWAHAIIWCNAHKPSYLRIYSEHNEVVMERYFT